MRNGLIGCGIALTGLIGAGCNVVGPASLASGRAAYGEVITKTNDEQLLRAIVLDRFSETTVLMAVTSVTANVSMRADAGAQFGIGPSLNYERNLVPLSLGFAYEENPTISYVPVETPAYLQQLMSPVSLEQALLMVRSAPNKAMALVMLVERLNGLTNPVSTDVPTGKPADFLRAAELMGKLSHAGISDLVSIPEGGYGLLIRLNELQDRGDLDELLRLLELTELLRPWGGIATGMAGGKKAEKGASDGEKKAASSTDAEPKKPSGLAQAETSVVEGPRRSVLVIPLRFSAVSDGSSIAVMTRSVYDLVREAAYCVDIPEEQIESGMAPAVHGFGEPKPMLQIQRSERKPSHAQVATKVHGYWYYIDERDLRSKDFFRLLTGMWSAQMAQAKSGFQAPVLTVGVSK